MNDELVHFGIRGMKWGVRRYQNADGSYTVAGKNRYNKDRKTSLFESIEDKKEHVETMRKQAGERIQFYGGKNVALNAIEKEADYKKKTTTAKAVTFGTLAATGAAYFAECVAASTPITAISAGTVALGTAFIAKWEKNSMLTHRIAITVLIWLLRNLAAEIGDDCNHGNNWR